MEIKACLVSDDWSSELNTPYLSSCSPVMPRLYGLALGATAATVIFGGLPPLVAHLLATNSGWAVAPGGMIAFVALCVIAVFGICLRRRQLAPDVGLNARAVYPWVMEPICKLSYWN